MEDSIPKEDFKPVCLLTARDLSDAWFTSLAACLEKNDDGTFKYSQRYRIDRGSYAGQERLEIDTFVIDIRHPGSGSLVPEMPEGHNLEQYAPTTLEAAQQYANYLMTAVKAPDEQYTYGERLVGPRVLLNFESLKYGEGADVDTLDAWLRINGEDYPLEGLPKTLDIGFNINPMEEVIKMYKEDGHNTNQATLEIGMPSDILLSDPPCLRMIDTRIRNNKLHFMTHFRSWDLYNGFPVNLAGLEQLKQYMADEIGVENGSIRATTKGLHLYDDMWKFAQKVARKELGLKKEVKKD